MAKWIGSVVAAAVLGTLVACAPATEEMGSADGRVTTGTTSAFDKNNVVSDDALLDKGALSADEIQAFFDKTPWNTKSVLADYTEGGKSAAEILSEASLKYGVNPIALMVRLQMEQSLLYKTTAPASTIKIAFGCGCPHSAVCSEKYEGFANQADCAAGTLSRSIAAATTSAGTASGWKKGVAKQTVDKVTITPANAATAALYTYTPYAGEAGGGEKGVGGAGLHKQVWDKVTNALSYTPTPRTATSTATTPSTDSDAGTGTGTGTGTTTDAGTGTGTGTGTTDPGTGSGSGSDESTGSTTASSADDASILQSGNAPPVTNNVPLPQSSGSKPGSSSSSSSSATVSSGDDGDDGSSDSDTTSERTSRPAVASSGCSSTGHAGGNAGMFAGIGLALAALVARRRR